MKIYRILIFIALIAIAFSFNNVHLGVEFTMVLILAFSPALLAASRHIRKTSVPISYANKKTSLIRLCFYSMLYSCFILSIMYACLIVDIALSIALDRIPIDLFFSLEDIERGLDLMRRTTQSILIMTNLIVSLFMIQRFSRWRPEGRSKGDGDECHEDKDKPISGKGLHARIAGF